MPVPTVKVEVDTGRLNRILKNLPGVTEDNNRAIAFAIEGRAKLKSPWDTGANRASIYVACGDHDGYAEAAAEAHRLNPNAVTAPLPKPNGHDAHVGPSMNYSLYLELGTRRMAARPYLVPAVREVEGQLVARWGNIADG